MSYSNRDKAKEAAREMRIRGNVYPHWVKMGRMSSDEADMRLSIMREIAQDYGTLADQDDIRNHRSMGNEAGGEDGA